MVETPVRPDKTSDVHSAGECTATLVVDAERMIMGSIAR
jgi:hypothetical protein